ncbi:MAG: hypothetical protein KIT27_04145 [Legionellales bacterium]|nr:hypothetical protein [Legionellales bacterium]
MSDRYSDTEEDENDEDLFPEDEEFEEGLQESEVPMDQDAQPSKYSRRSVEDYMERKRLREELSSVFDDDDEFDFDDEDDETE